MIPTTATGRALLALKLTDPSLFEEKIRAALRSAPSTEAAARNLGVAERTLFRWKREFLSKP
jgi:hypothetical protein